MSIEKNFETLSKAKIRLNKVISESGFCSRRKADELIKQGLVTVNGKIVTELGTKVNYSDLVTIEGKPLKHVQRFTYVLLNKPKDTICTTNDERNRKTVIDLINIKTRLYPVGRLDRNTTGVLLLTNDGELAARLMHPKYQVMRVYNVTLEQPLKLQDANKIASGIEYNKVKYSPCKIEIYSDDPTKLKVLLWEGKTHEIKNMFQALGYTVKKLDRKIFANLSTQSLKRGEWRYLTRREVLELQKLVGLR